MKNVASPVNFVDSSSFSAALLQKSLHSLQILLVGVSISPYFRVVNDRK